MIDKELFIELQNYVDMHMDSFAIKLNHILCESVYESKAYMEIDDFVKHNRKPTFNRVLFGYIDRKSVSDTESTFKLVLIASISQKYANPTIILVKEQLLPWL